MVPKNKAVQEEGDYKGAVMVISASSYRHKFFSCLENMSIHLTKNAPVNHVRQWIKKKLKNDKKIQSGENRTNRSSGFTPAIHQEN